MGAILSDEGDSFNNINGRYERNGRVANLNVFLKAWDCMPIRVSRGRKTTKLHDVALTILVQTQPDILRSVCNSRELVERGFMPRFLICIPRDMRDQVTGKTTPVRPETLSLYIESMKALYDKAPCELRLDSEASNMINDYHLNARRKLKTDYADIEEYAAKAENQILRLAGVLHTMHSQDTTITATTMRNAITLYEYFLSFIQNSSALLEDQSQAKMIRKIVEYLPEQGEIFFASSLKRKIHLNKKDDTYLIFEAALTILVETGVLYEFLSERKDSRRFKKMVKSESLQKAVHVAHVGGSSFTLSHSSGMNGMEEDAEVLCMSRACRVHVAPDRVHVAPNESDMEATYTIDADISNWFVAWHDDTRLSEHSTMDSAMMWVIAHAPAGEYEINLIIRREPSADEYDPAFIAAMEAI